MTLRELPVPTVPPDRPARAVLARVVTVLGCLLLLTSLLAPAGAAGTGLGGARAHPEQAPDPNQVRLTLRQVTPQPMRPGAAMTLAGTLRNVGTTAVAVEAVRAHTGYRGLDTRSAVRSWAAGTSDVSATRPLGEQVLERRLAPGDQARFRIEVPAGTVEPPFSFASLPLLLDVAGGGEDPGTVGRLRSFLVWDGQDGYDHEPLQLSWLVPLTAPADPDLFSTDPQARAQAWEQAAGSQSRATRLVRELSGLGVTFVADPALLTPVAPGGLGPVSGEASEPATEPTGPDSQDTDEPAGYDDVILRGDVPARRFTSFWLK
ncbi:DUF6049 family protein, partial [Ornithinicoccus halotolerans]|uniref:DUF6049 family protein n=1 Tax=Ornithinicoccus halotolerans TaxID=1748220 RepID=UPI001296057B